MHEVQCDQNTMIQTKYLLKFEIKAVCTSFNIMFNEC